MKQLSYFLQAAALSIFYGLMRMLPLSWASAFGGMIGRNFGPLTRSHKTAIENLKRAFPNNTEEQNTAILTDMWDNLGRTMAEYPHLKKIAADNVTIENEDIILDALKAGKSIIFTGAHFSNWEIQSIFFMLKYQFPITLTYRAPNNPWVEKLLRRMRPRADNVEYVAKSRQAGRNLVQTLQQKRHIGVLIDQKNNEGIAVPFFGIDAMTSPVFVQLAQKLDAQIMCVRTKREKGPHFTIRAEKPTALHNQENKPKDTADVLLDIHHQIENWITEAPAQWLWIHNRWPK